MKWLGIVGLLIVGMVVWYGVSYPSVTVRYRLTLEALVDGELKTASGVREVTYSKGLAVGGQGALSIAVRGEAIALDLADRGTLFALVSAGLDGRSGPEWIVLRAFDFDGMPSRSKRASSRFYASPANVNCRRIGFLSSFDFGTLAICSLSNG